MTSDMTLGELIRSTRKALGMTQVDLADMLGDTAPQTVSAWERDVSIPRRKTMKALASLIGIPEGPPLVDPFPWDEHIKLLDIGKTDKEAVVVLLYDNILVQRLQDLQSALVSNEVDHVYVNMPVLLLELLCMANAYNNMETLGEEE